MPGISENSSRIARNTILLYFRMLLLMFIGLFTSRVVLDALGVEDYGVYGAVGGLVMLFTVVTNSVSQSICRYITWNLGFRSAGLRPPKDLGKRRSGTSTPEAGSEAEAAADGTLHKVFSTAVVMQLLFCLLLLILTETLGLWWLNNHMNIPAGRGTAAFWVLQCSMVVLMVNLLSVPFNATIISHERMDVFAWISLGEAVLKLSVALLLYLSAGDKLILYAAFMLVVAVLVRLTYGIVCRRLFSETRGRMVFDGKLLREMTSFAGWNVLGSGAYIVNTQGVNQLVNIFFGVAVNAARNVALQVENILKQFLTNFLTALNPQITKNYASGDKAASFHLVNKGVKYSGLILVALGVPIVLEAPALLDLWLKNVPEQSVIFTRLTVFCIMADLLFNPLLTLIQADGRIKGYYIVSSLVALCCFAASWAAFAGGAPAFVSYIFFAAAYFLVDIVKLVFARRLAGYSFGTLCKESLVPVLFAGLIVSSLPLGLHLLLPEGGWRLLAVLAATLVCLVPACWNVAFTPGEREYVLRKIGRWLPALLFLRIRYKMIMGRTLHLCRPRLFSEKIQWLKIHDRQPEYTTLADKLAFKDVVAERLGPECVIPTLAVWENAADIDFDSLPERFVLKCTHDSGSVLVCRDRSSFDTEAARASLDKAVKRNFYYAAREWSYRDIPARIIAEPFLDDGHADGLTDYKFFCFNGEPKFLYVSRGLEEHATAHISFVMPDWTPAPFRRSDYEPFGELPPRPQSFDRMMEASRELSAGIPFVRVDFYEVEGHMLLSEMTFYPCGGFMPMGSREQDLAIGEMLDLHGVK